MYKTLLSLQKHCRMDCATNGDERYHLVPLSMNEYTVNIDGTIKSNFITHLACTLIELL